ncbi:hypothetical protein HDU76_005084, partial [Blyttiomyces sp. JEL0837]
TFHLTTCWIFSSIPTSSLFTKFEAVGYTVKVGDGLLFSIITFLTTLLASILMILLSRMRPESKVDEYRIFRMRFGSGENGWFGGRAKRNVERRRANGPRGFGGAVGVSDDARGFVGLVDVDDADEYIQEEENDNLGREGGQWLAAK